jgi:glycosyltransferase involved in cell wall biosynthesis
MNVCSIRFQDHHDYEAAAASKMRVAIFSDCLPERNGAGSYYHDLVAQIGSRVAELRVFQPATKRRCLRLALPLPGDSTQKLITPNLPRLVREFSSLKPNLVIAVTPGPFGLLGMTMARQSRSGFITAFHTDFEDVISFYRNPLFRKVAGGYLRRVNRSLFNASEAVLVNNKDLVDTVSGLGAQQVEIMGTPLSRAFLDPPLQPPRPQLKQVLFAGRLAPEKNLMTVVEAARTMPQLRFVIAGDGPLRKDLAEAAKACHNLVLTGWLERKALCRQFDAADLLLLPSRMESFGTVALEAMARGRPALVTENAGIHQWQILGEALISLQDGQSLASCLDEITAIPTPQWRHRSALARLAAETLNHQTVRQWLGFIARYGRMQAC